ncbi:glycosyltransferase, partial [Klebsiella aerogenes]
LNQLESAKVKALLKGPKQLPQISVVMPVYNPNLAWLQEAVQSVRDQVYPNWQLCIADDKSTNPKVREE